MNEEKLHEFKGMLKQWIITKPASSLEHDHAVMLLENVCSVYENAIATVRKTYQNKIEELNKRIDEQSAEIKKLKPVNDVSKEIKPGT